jgi:hypothetical protein
MPKPGYRTTEFYATLAALLVAARVVVEYIRNRTTVKLHGPYGTREIK